MRLTIHLSHAQAEPVHEQPPLFAKPNQAILAQMSCMAKKCRAIVVVLVHGGAHINLSDITTKSQNPSQVQTPADVLSNSNTLSHDNSIS